MPRIRAAIIGSGNIGTDLVMKARRSEWIEPVWVVGIDPQSDGLAKAAALGLKTTSAGIDGLVPHLASDDIRIAFDATSAYAHKDHAQKINAHGALMIDLTPAAIGPYCIPPVNLQSLLDGFRRKFDLCSEIRFLANKLTDTEPVHALYQQPDGAVRGA